MIYRNNIYILISAAYLVLGILLIVLCHASLFALTAVLAAFLGGAYLWLRFMLLAPLKDFQSTLQSIARGNTSLRVNLEKARVIRPIGELVNMVAGSMNEDLLRLKKLERFRSEFLGNVSHELRTPIFSIQGLLETLVNGAIDDASVNKNFLLRALANTERLNRLLEDLIDISRVESGELKLKFRFFDVVPLVRTVIGELQEKAAQQNISLTWNASESQFEAYGDKERIRQVLVNLVDNALKYSGPGASVTVTLRKNNDAVEITIADTGIGISPEHLPRIFERFYRIDKDRSRDAGGTGLGLAIAKHIVEAHHSTISAASSPGKGTQFTFCLPTTIRTGQEGAGA
jgi:two-component system, OmpR family, phosphate regulon sensor histidine kinase PhoR